MFERHDGAVAGALAKWHELREQNELAADRVVVDEEALWRRYGRVRGQMGVVQSLARGDLW